MDLDRIRKLLHPFLGGNSLSSSQSSQISKYMELLLKWNAKMNLTAIRDPDEIVTRHFGESLFAARHLFPAPPNAGTSAIDLGSGAGFPGIPIKIWAPGLKLTLIEAAHKKATFLRELVRTLELKEVSVLSSRAEDVEAKASAVTLRAVERFESALGTARSLLDRNGTLALLIGASQVKVAVARLPDLLWDEPIPIPLSQSRVLLVGRSLAGS